MTVSSSAEIVIGKIPTERSKLSKRFIKILRQTDQVEFVVGTKINDETDDPNLAAKIGIRFPLIDSMVRALEQNYLKEVEVRYI